MKRIFKLSALALLAALLITSCKKEENKVVYEGGTPPVLNAASTAPVVLLKVNENNVVNTFSWTNPNYKFNTGVSSQDVTYTLQIDTTGSNFTNPHLGEKVISKSLSTTLTVKELNSLLLGPMLLQEDMPHNLEFRLKATLTGSTVPLYSNVIKIIATPYLDVVVTLPKDLPTPNANDGSLFLVGDATAGGWNNPVPVPSQKFTQTSSTTYQITTNLIGGKQYLLLPKNGDWSNKYAVASNSVPGLSSGGAFGANLSDNFPGPATSGLYKIVVNFKTGQFTVKPA